MKFKKIREYFQVPKSPDHLFVIFKALKGDYKITDVYKDKDGDGFHIEYDTGDEPLIGDD